VRYLISITWLRVRPNEAALRGEPLSRRPYVNIYATYAALVSRQCSLSVFLKLASPAKSINQNISELYWRRGVSRRKRQPQGGGGVWGLAFITVLLRRCIICWGCVALNKAWWDCYRCVGKDAGRFVCGGNSLMLSKLRRRMDMCIHIEITI
jgi:hypothetical protein